MKKKHIFTSESVSIGHPDKICDAISDAILDAAQAQDRNARVACETMATTNFVINAGEVRVKNWNKINTEQIARDVVGKIGYSKEEYLFCNTSFVYENRLHEQSQNISAGVDRENAELGAGDQGMMFGYATSETKELMPSPIIFAHQITSHFTKLREEGQVPYLRPDAKSQVSVKYIDEKPSEITTIVLSHQTDDIDPVKIERELKEHLRSFFSDNPLVNENTQFIINPTGKFVIGGPHGDAGLTGRKIIVDTYGGAAPHGGGAFSGKDPSKVDRSAAYYARYVAKNIVSSGIAEKCLIQVSYAIGIAKPISILVDTLGTGKVDDQKISESLLSMEIFDFRPHSIIASLDLDMPEGWKYVETSRAGHFGNEKFPWEKTNKTEELKKLFSI